MALWINAYIADIQVVFVMVQVKMFFFCSYIFENFSKACAMGKKLLPFQECYERARAKPLWTLLIAFMLTIKPMLIRYFAFKTQIWQYNNIWAVFIILPCTVDLQSGIPQLLWVSNIALKAIFLLWCYSSKMPHVIHDIVFNLKLRDGLKILCLSFYYD